MKILTVNAGSSSLKFNVIELPEEKELISGYFQRIGIEGSFYYVKIDGEKTEHQVELKNHIDAVEYLKKELLDNKIVSSLDEIAGVGHRLVHGGDRFNKSILIDEDKLKEVEKFNDLAPLHNPAIKAEYSGWVRNGVLTVILFSVKVPVLSKHKVFTLDNDSTEYKS